MPPASRVVPPLSIDAVRTNLDYRCTNSEFGPVDMHALLLAYIRGEQ